MAASHSASLISASAVETSLSSLKNCQAYIDTGMEITTGVALDFIQSGCDASHVDEMESVMLQYAALNRDLNQYLGAVEETMRKVRRDPPEEIPDLKELVNMTYNASRKKNKDEALKKTDKFIQFKEQVRDLRKQMGVSQESADQDSEDDDEDIAVTQSIANFTCPITQVSQNRLRCLRHERIRSCSRLGTQKSH
ncbi:E3 SUMO-protein ligase NSE2 isoform X2 [Hyla sarda]|uniref:E3 SUMO-protein ligase NSE2 isoform X2 n=1 Tax=Hyla sarda TaxID=327740 RepID=UPI0024C40837|nr:E3 SUMO-protein ligase NSE2 isoform X2 [Hyla sarda]